MSKESLGYSPESQPNLQRAIDSQVDIGPNSLLWQYLGDRRMGLTGMSAGILQLMHPAIGAGVSEHSDFFGDPWGRVLRSLPQIINVVYDPQGEKIGRKIRDYHLNIGGQDEQGRRYHALNPETFWWAHATFHHMVEEEIDRFDRRPLSLGDREQLYQETNTWYSRYAVSTKPVPPDYAGFRKKWDDICANTLELTPAAKSVVDRVNAGSIERRPDIPELPWKMGLKIPGNELIRILAIGGLPEKVRDRFAIPWTKLDQMKLRTIERGVQYFWPKEWPNDLPDIRYHPQAQTRSHPDRMEDETKNFV
jgi:uncharacterized protein (DUF2236 family)